jgi:hypothetical protein
MAPVALQWIDVRFGSLADIAAALPNVRFTLKSGHRALRAPQSAAEMNAIERGL